MYYVQAPVGFDANVTLTQRTADCVNRGYDAQYRLLSSFISFNNQEQTLELPLSSFATNLNGANFDFTHTRVRVCDCVRDCGMNRSSSIFDYKDVTLVNANSPTNQFIIYKAWLKGTCSLGTTVNLASPVAGPSPTPSPVPATGPVYPTCLTTNNVSPGATVTLSASGGTQGWGFSNGGTATQANGVVTLTPGAGGDYFFAMLATTGCFNAQAYSVLRILVSFPVGGSFSIAFDIYAAE